jgi:predicted Fe-Mo cluster-binding NifX family protein
MRVAVPTNDGEMISGHFGRSRKFLVFEVEGGRVVGRSVKENAGPNGEHSHGGVLQALAGCDVVIAQQMGDGMAAALESRGVKRVSSGHARTVEEAVRLYLEGELAAEPAGGCGHGHGCA